MLNRAMLFTFTVAYIFLTIAWRVAGLNERPLIPTGSDLMVRVRGAFSTDPILHPDGRCHIRAPVNLISGEISTVSDTKDLYRASRECQVVGQHSQP